MTERPILFSGPMIKKLLAGQKTQTRRIVTTEWNHGFIASEFYPYVKRPLKRETDDGDFVTFSEPYTERHGEPVWFYSWGNARWLRCPYGKVGDILWVRETCRAKELTTAEAYASEEEYPPGLDGVLYVADNVFRPIENNIEASERWGKLNAYHGKRGATVPPIHMPRWASRITLRLTEVRVEQLMDISADDAEAEGWPHRDTGGVGVALRDAYPIGWYANLWNDINGKGSWEQNPWVWVLTFQRAIDQPSPTHNEEST